MRRRFGLLLAAAVAGSLSCGSRVTDPAISPLPREDIRFELTTSAPSGSPGEPVTIRVTVRNAGESTVSPLPPCPNPPRVYGADGSELLLQNPMVHVICMMVPLPPGEGWEQAITFDGRYYSPAGETLDASPGTYEVIARLSYSSAAAGTVHLIREAPFTWR